MTPLSLSSMRRLADRLLAALRRRFDRPHLLPRDAAIEVTVWVAEVLGQPGKVELLWHHEPAGLSAEGLAKLLATASTLAAAQGGLISTAVVQAPQPPAAPVSSARRAASHPYQKVKGKR